MAFSNMSVFVLLLASTAILLVTSASAEGFLRQCAKLVRNECGDEIYFGIFYQNMTQSAECCYELLHMGKLCHDTLVKNIAVVPEFKAHLSEIIRRSEQVWNRCVLIEKTLAAPTPQPSWDIN